ncbi:MAG: hypothetical protein Q4A61_06365 [Porphyromonadaceae bacterium]|nr:hypothetical protein [Porphyromonadaceae bacterium]
MKLKNFWAAALAMLALTACNKDIEPSNEPLTTSTTSEPKTRVVHIDLSAGQQQDALRVAFGLQTDGSGALSGLQMSDRDVIMRVAVRRGDGEPQIQDLHFKKTKGQNHATYSGQISVPTGGTGSYKIAALLMREVGSKEDGAEVFLVNDKVPGRSARESNTNVIIPQGDELKINIPYISHWQDITITEAGVVAPVTLDMKPFGTILRMRIKNETTAPQTFHWVNLLSNAFVHYGAFSLKDEESGRPRFFQGNTEETLLKLAPGVTVPGKVGDNASYSPWMYTWVAPRLNPQHQPFRTLAQLYIKSNMSEDTPYQAFATKAALPTGSVALTLTYNGPHQSNYGEVFENPVEFGATPSEFKSPLSFISEFPLNQAGDAFISSYDPSSADVGRFTYDQAMAFNTPRSIDGHSYSLPSVQELRGIFPPQVNSGTPMIRLPFGRAVEVTEHDIKLGDVVGSFQADYIRIQSPATLFAIRFKGGDDRYRTAFRYRHLREGTHNNLVVESTYLGNETVTLSDIQQNSFWTNRPASGPKKVEMRRFPAYGSIYNTRPNEIVNQNRVVNFWSSTAQDYDGGYILYSQPLSAHVYLSLFSTSWIYPVYLWKRN